MIKKTLLLLVSIILGFGFTSKAHFAYSVFPTLGDQKEPVEIVFSETPIDFNNKPFILNGEVMIPTRAFFERIGTQIFWSEKTEAFIAYKDNTFLKFKKDSNLAFLNGKEIALSVAPFAFNNTLYVPLSTSASAFSIDYTLDRAFLKASADYRDPVYQYRTFDYQTYKRIQLLSYGVSFYIPDHWNSLEGVSNRYGIENDFQSERLDVTVLPLDLSYTRSGLFETLKQNLAAEHGEAFNILEAKTFKPGDYTISSMIFTTDNRNEKGDLTHHALYVILEGGTGYILSGHYESDDWKTTLITFDNIASTFQINKLTINSLQEHYVELTPFFENQMTLGQRLYSNMLVENEIPFKGVIGGERPIRGLKVGVKKDQQRMDFYIPVIDNRWDGILYTPFGLGKHNVTVVIDYYAEPNPTTPLWVDSLLAGDLSLDSFVESALEPDFALDSENAMLKFSVVNISSETIKDILPSQLINYDTPDVYAAVNRVTFNLTSEYAKARALYDWVFDNYTLSPEVSNTGILSVEQMVNARDGNALEICVLYAGLMRALDIPARIVRGTQAEGSVFWVETFINGRWLISDIVRDLSENQNEVNHFNLNRTLHYSQFDKTEILPF